jgi:hypothetical protein
MGIWCDACMRIVKGRYTIIRLVCLLMFSAIGGTIGAIVGALYFKAWRCTQIEQNDYRK